MKKIVYFLLTGFCISFLNAQDGRFPVIFENLSGHFTDDEIFIYGVGIDESGQWRHYAADGDMLPFNTEDINAPGHLTKNSQNYANYAFTLAEAANFRMNTHVGGGRFYISLGSSVYIPISNNGWGGPNPDNPSDPNADVIYDLYEFTYVYNELSYGGNISMVDQFGFPMTARLVQDATSYDETVGATMSREEIFSLYNSTVAPEFRGLANEYRIVAPRSSHLFAQGGVYEDYLQPYIDEFWSYYTTNQFQMTRLGQTFTGQVSGDQFVFSGAASGTLNKPTTIDVFACAGALASAGMTTGELLMGAEFSAAFNRGVAMNPSVWWGSHEDYYGNTLQNDYAKLFHDISIDNRAYAFAYDDINDQSSVKILGNSNPPTSLTITIQPFGQPVGAKHSFRRPEARTNPEGIPVRISAGSQIHIANPDRVQSMSIFSVDGKTVFSKSSPNKHLYNPGRLPKGIYYIRITDKQGCVSIDKFILF